MSLRSFTIFFKTVKNSVTTDFNSPLAQMALALRCLKYGSSLAHNEIEEQAFTLALANTKDKDAANTRTIGMNTLDTQSMQVARIHPLVVTPVIIKLSTLMAVRVAANDVPNNAVGIV